MTIKSRGFTTKREKNLPFCKTLIQYDILKHRKDYLEEMYIEEIKSFFNNVISHVYFLSFSKNKYKNPLY